MGKIKNYWLKITTGVKDLVKTYPVTMGLIFILTVCMTVDTNISHYPIWLQKTFTFFAFESLASFYCESRFNKKKMRYGFLGIFSILHIVLVHVVWTYPEADFINRCVVVYGSVLFILSIYHCFKNTKQVCSEYAIRVFSNLAKVAISYSILVIGISMITALFIFLILDGKGYSILGRFMILLIGLYLVPFSIKAITDIKEDVGKFMKGLVLYILFPITVIAFVIIYLYMAKLVFFQKMPSNQIFRILFFLFIWGMPIIIMATKYKEAKQVRRLTNILPYAFIPFILLQSYSLGVRCMEHGITATRYWGWMILLLEGATIIGIVYKNQKHLAKGLLLLCGVIVISYVVPYVNLYETSARSQANMLKQYLELSEGRELSKKEKNTLYGAYSYLEYQEKELKEKYMPSLTQEQINWIESIQGSSRYDRNTREYLTYTNKLETIPIAGYDTLWIGSYYNYSQPIDLQQITFENQKNENIKRIWNIEHIVKSYIEADQNHENLDSIEKEWVIDENTKIILKYLSVGYQEEEVDTINIEAYILEKSKNTSK